MGNKELNILDHLSNNESLETSVQRDIDMLLNCKQNAYALRKHPALESFKLSSYGIPNFSRLSLNSDADKNTLSHSIADSIALHVPQLSHIETNPIEESGLSWQLNIDANIESHKQSQILNIPILFEPNTTNFKVEIS